MKVIITKKNTRKYNKTKKYKLKGGADFGNVKDAIKKALELKLKDIYNFFPTVDNKTIGNDPKNMFRLENVTDIKVNIKESNINYKEIKESVEELYNGANTRRENEYKKYEIIFPDYHGNYTEKTTALKLCPSNVYICFFSLYNRSSLVLNKRDPLSTEDFILNMSETDFKNIVKFKVLLSDPKYNHEMKMKNLTLYKECFSQGQWIYPGQYYHDIKLSIGIDDDALPDTYKCEYDGDIKSEIINNRVRNKSISAFLNNVLELPIAGKKYIIFINTCKPDTTNIETMGYDITENNFLNHNFNLCLYENLLQNTIPEKITSFFCADSLPYYKELFYKRYICYNDYELKSLKKINDNLHPYIPKLIIFYNNLLSLTDNMEDIKSWYNDHPEEIYFILSLSFNKLKKFIFKVRNIKPNLCAIFIRYLRYHTKFKKVLSKNSSLLKKFYHNYKSHDPDLEIVYHNVELQKLLFNYLEICNFFNYEIQKTTERIVSIFPSIGLIDLHENAYFKTQLTFRPTEIYLVGYDLEENPFYDLDIMRQTNLLSNITEINVTKCKVLNKYDFNILLEIIRDGTLKNVYLDDTLFKFKPFRSDEHEGVDFEKLINKFNNDGNNEIIIDDLRVHNDQNHMISNDITFNKFRIVDISFQIMSNFLYIKKVNIENDMKTFRINGCLINNIDFKHNRIDTIVLKYYEFDFDSIPTAIATDNIKMINGYSNIDSITIMGIEEKPTFSFFYLFDDFGNNTNNNNNNFRQLTEIILKDIKDVNFMANYDEINTPNLEVLEIKNCEIDNIRFTLRKIDTLIIEDSKINTKSQVSSTDINYDLEIYETNDLYIEIKNSDLINFNIYLQIKLKKSSITFINSNKHKNHFERPLQIGRKVFYYIGSTFFRRTLRTREMFNKNKKILL